ncbi:DUF551 domain-containing protein [Escherichia coli]
MTAQLSREELRALAVKRVESLKVAITQSAFTNIRRELEGELQLAEFALAGMDSEPVAWVMADDLKDTAIISTPAYPSLDDAKDMTIGEIVPLYVAPPAPLRESLQHQASGNRPAVWVRIGDNNHAPDCTLDHDEAREWESRGLEVLRMVAPAPVAAGWIACRERMPELNTRVLLYFPDYGGHIEDGCIGDEGDGPYHYFFDGDSLRHEPTHWMPLPEAPATN